MKHFQITGYINWQIHHLVVCERKYKTRQTSAKLIMTSNLTNTSDDRKLTSNATVSVLSETKFLY